MQQVFILRFLQIWMLLNWNKCQLIWIFGRAGVKSIAPRGGASFLVDGGMTGFLR